MQPKTQKTIEEIGELVEFPRTPATDPRDERIAELERRLERIEHTGALAGDDAERRPARQGPISLAEFKRRQRARGYASEVCETFKNPLPQPMRFDVYFSHACEARDGSNPDPAWNGHVTIECAAGGTVEIPTRFVIGLHDVRGGVIVGGVAPQLERVGEEPLPLHPSLRAAPEVKWK